VKPGARIVVSAFLLLALRPGAAVGDRAAATALADQARKAAEEGDHDHAGLLWERAVQEDESYGPARLGVAMGRLARGQGRDGLAELRAALAAVASAPEATTAWAGEIARAKKRLTELEAAEAAVKAKVAKHVEASLALVVKWSAKDPELARGILGRVLRIDPTNAEAQRLFGTLGEAQGRVVSLFNGRDQKGWMSIEKFRVVEGILEGEADDAGKITVTEAKHTGDFDFRGEVRMLEKRGDLLMFSLVLLRAPQDATTIGTAEGLFFSNDEVAGERTKGFQVKLADVDPALDLKAWNRFEVRLRGDKLTGWLNGKQLGESDRRQPERPVHLGLMVQLGRVQFRALEMRRL
jgi:tetratricopeptide (TPR) repeat protein